MIKREELGKIYCTKDIDSYENRIQNLIKNFKNTFKNENEISLFSAPGRTEIGGNHTDHQQVLMGQMKLEYNQKATL